MDRGHIVEAFEARDKENYEFREKLISILEKIHKVIDKQEVDIKDLQETVTDLILTGNTNTESK